MPVSPTAIDRPQAIPILIAPARPLPAAPQKPQTNRPRQGEAEAPRALALSRAAAAEVRGPIGSTATVGGNAARIGAPGIAGIARNHAAQVGQDAFKAIGKNVDARA